VISALLIVGGLITCSVAKDIALTDNYTLFHDSEEGGTYVRHDFDAADVNKIELLITDADVYIFDTAEDAYIEFNNFRDGLYTLSTAGKVISMDEIPDLKSIFNLQSGFSFSGMRYILRAGTVSLGEKRVNIYLPKDAALKILSVEADNCTLYADGIGHSFDIQMKAAETAAVQADQMRTGCTMNIHAASADIQLKSCVFNAIELTAPTARMSADEVYWESMTLDIDDGEVTLVSAVTLSPEGISVTGSGRFIMAGQETELPWRADDDTAVSDVKADIGKATLRLDWAVDPIIN